MGTEKGVRNHSEQIVADRLSQIRPITDEERCQEPLVRCVAGRTGSMGRPPKELQTMVPDTCVPELLGAKARTAARQ